jgi:hypothetical protein
MDKRYQVFISSTFADLQEERAKVQQAIMELDCIPAGMEIFPAIDEEQFEFIKRVIDDCDYYLLIIGGRYGSVSDAGVSYTQMEYEYAISKGLKVMAFLHQDPESLPLKKSEQDAAAREKLAAFRADVSTKRLVKYWSTANELPGLVALSLSKTIKTYPAIGWIRANDVLDPQVYKEMSDLRKENQELKEALTKQKGALVGAQSLAGLNELIKVRVHGVKNTGAGQQDFSTESESTWGELFSFIGPYLLKNPRDNEVQDRMAGFFISRSDENKMKGISFSRIELSNSDFNTIKIQFKGLGLVQLHPTGVTLIWKLTDEGEKTLISVRGVKAEIKEGNSN